MATEIQNMGDNRTLATEITEEWSISPEDIRQVEEWLEDKDYDALQVVVDDYHPSEQADLIQHLDNTQQRLELAQYLNQQGEYEFWADLDEVVSSEMMDELDVKDLTNVVRELESDDAVTILESLDTDAEREAIIQNLDAEDQQALRQSFSWPEDSAGRMMNHEFIAFPSYMNVGDAIDWFRREAEEDDNDLPDQFYNIYLLNSQAKPMGQVALSKLLQTKRNVELKDISQGDLPTIAGDMDQEDVAFLFKQIDLVAAPVVDDNGRMIGEITIDDVVDVIEEEHEEDLMALGGVHEEDLYERIRPTAKARLRWLIINLFTCVLSTVVIAFFADTIEAVVVLAALMPIVASMGGNAGTQTLTVAIRAIATRELGAANAWRFIRKEGIVGLINGVLLAIIGGVVTYFWQFDVALAFVIAGALILNLIVAALSGALIPLGLTKFGIDPAVASSVVLTTVTDVIGFMVFLGFAKMFLL